MPDHRHRVPSERTFTEPEYEQLSRGFVPSEMGHRWFGFLEDDCLFFHRSWNGECVYEVQLERRGHHWMVTGAWVNSRFQQFDASGQESLASMLAALVEGLVQKTTPFAA
jgi:hypothetical protein